MAQFCDDCIHGRMPSGDGLTCNRNHPVVFRIPKARLTPLPAHPRWGWSPAAKACPDYRTLPGRRSYRRTLREHHFGRR